MPRLPRDTEHLALAGRTGTGKTSAALDMLSRRDLTKMPWIIVDHKGDENIKQLKLEKIKPTQRFLPTRGLFHMPIRYGNQGDRASLEDFFERAFRHGHVGIYIDEGHLVGISNGIRTILVAGRNKHVPLVWISQRAQTIDPFVWSQSSFYRVFDLQTKLDKKRFNENFPIDWRPLAPWRSYYYDVGRGEVSVLAPARPLPEVANEIDNQMRHNYNVI